MFELSGESSIKIKSRLEAQGFRAKNRTVYLKVKRGGLLEECSNVSKVYTTSQVKDLTEKLRKNKSLETLQQIRNSLASGDEFVATFLGIPYGLTELVGCLTCGDETMAIEACCCVINLTTGKHKTTFPVLKASAPYLITFLRGRNVQLQDCSAWALGNMAADCNSCRKHLTEQGLIDALVPLLDSSDANVSDSTVFALSCYTKFCDKHNRDICELGTVDKVTKLLNHPETSLSRVPQILALLFNLTSTIEEVVPFFKTNNIGQTLMKIISNMENFEYFISVNTQVIRCLGNLSTASDCSALSDLFVNEEVFVNFVMAALTSNFNHLKKECLWMLSNLIQSCLGSVIIKPRNRTSVIQVICDICLKTLDDTTISESLNVLSLLITDEYGQNQDIAHCLSNLQECISKRPHSTVIATKVARTMELLR